MREPNGPSHTRSRTRTAHPPGVRTKAKSEVERSAEEARTKAQAQADKLGETASASEAHISSSWNDLQKQWTAHIEKCRDIDAMKEQVDAKKAEIRADDAEDDALFVIDYAYARRSRRPSTQCSMQSPPGRTQTSSP
jgi:aryl-alcohol dehydrogenase-like predicted oxidoreductase